MISALNELSTGMCWNCPHHHFVKIFLKKKKIFGNTNYFSNIIPACSFKRFNRIVQPKIEILSFFHGTNFFEAHKGTIFATSSKPKVFQSSKAIWYCCLSKSSVHHYTDAKSTLQNIYCNVACKLITFTEKPLQSIDWHERYGNFAPTPIKHSSTSNLKSSKGLLN